jgi:hypothetical protein
LQDFYQRGVTVIFYIIIYTYWINFLILRKNGLP